jgi:Ca2+-binding EF-hand superfamily protein
MFQVQLLLKQFDRDGNNQLDINEFIGFYAEAKAMLVSLR